MAEELYYSDYYNIWIAKEAEYRTALSISQDQYAMLERLINQTFTDAIASYRSDNEIADVIPIGISGFSILDNFNISLTFTNDTLISFLLIDYIKSFFGSQTFELNDRTVTLQIKEPAR